MIDAEGREHLRKLQKRVACDRKFACVNAALEDLCHGIYHSDLDIFECQETGDRRCKLCRAFGSKFVCACPLRKYIARNFPRWSAESTGVLVKRAQAKPGDDVV